MESNKILLISPSSNSFYTLCAPLGLSYLAAELTDCQVYGIDLNVYRYVFQMTREKILQTIEKIIDVYEINYVGISILEETMEEAFQIANLCSAKDVTVIAGGIMPTLFPESFSKDFDYILRGDTEGELKELIACLSSGKSISHIQGLSYQDQDTIWKHQGKTIPPNCKPHIISRRDIFDKFHFNYQYKTARMITSRGCIYQCSFCTNRKIDSDFCRRSAADIVSEITYLIQECKMEQIIFSDDQFLGTNLDEYKEALEIIQAISPLLKEHNVRLNFQARADHIVKCQESLPEFFHLLHEISQHYADPKEDAHISAYGKHMNGIGIDIGIEAFSEETLQYFKKGISSKTNITCLEYMKTYEIDLGIYMILFTPVVTMEQIIFELEHYYKYYLKDSYSSKLVFSNLFKPLVAYKGTELYEQLEQVGKLIDGHYYSFEDLRVAAFYVVIQSELVELCSNMDCTMEDMYQAVLELAYRCKDLDISGDTYLSQVICEQYDPEIINNIYSTYF